MADNTKNLKWGSPEWRTHLRRSLAQRKRHGEKITDIEGLIDHIQKQGPAKGKQNGVSRSQRKTGHSINRSKRSSKPSVRSNRRRTQSTSVPVSRTQTKTAKPVEIKANESGLYQPPVILKVR
jgi:hypothetical protein